MAITRRNPDRQATILHSDHGSQFTSWAFGRRLVDAGIVPSMGSIGDCYDNSLVESFWGTMQLELLDSRIWRTRTELATAIFEWIETSHQPKLSSSGRVWLDGSGSEGVVAVVELSGEQAVVESTEHVVEHLP